MLVAWGRARRAWVGRHAETGARCAPRAPVTGPARAASARSAPAEPASSLSTASARPDAQRARPRHRVQADPLAGRLAREVDGELGVDEQEAAEVQRAAHPVARVRGDEDAGPAASVGSPATSGWRIRIQTTAGPASRNEPDRKR